MKSPITFYQTNEKVIRGPWTGAPSLAFAGSISYP